MHLRYAAADVECIAYLITRRWILSAGRCRGNDSDSSLLAPPLIAFGFSSSVHTQHHHTRYIVLTRVLCTGVLMLRSPLVVSLVIGLVVSREGDDFSSLAILHESRRDAVETCVSS